MTKYQTIASSIVFLGFIFCVSLPDVIDRYGAYQLNLARIQAGQTVVTCKK